MSFILKIVQGPNAGAEIALADGLKVTLGKDDACDIVLADATLPDGPCALDVSAGGVTFAAPGESAREIKPFEVVVMGTTAFAIGPAEGAWGELTWPSDKNGEEAVEEAESESEEVADEAAPESTPGEREDSGQKRRRRGLGCLLFLVLLLLLAVAAWLLWPRAVARWPKLGSLGTRVFQSEEESQVSGDESGETQALPVPLRESLDGIAAQYGLELTEKDGAPLLRGNLRRRTERQAIRSLALAANPGVKFDLVDDETLKSAAEDLVFGISEGTITVAAATNRVVALAGQAGSVALLEKVLRALEADLPAIEGLDTSAVKVGGMIPAPRPTRPANPPAGERPAAAPKSAAPKDFQIAGVLTKPYPCLVLRNGLRCTVGAQVGGAVIEKIEADKITLREGDRTFTVEP